MSQDLPSKVYSLVCSRFASASQFEQQVKALIQEYSNHVENINRRSVLQIMKNIRKNYKPEDWQELKFMFKSIFVYILNEHHHSLHLGSIESLFELYPEFTQLREIEQRRLLEFRNLFVIAMLIVEPNYGKQELISLVGRMCGAIYVLGGGQTAETARRVLIYQRESGIPPRKSYKVRKNVTEQLDKALAENRTEETRNSQSPDQDKQAEGKKTRLETTPPLSIASVREFWMHRCAAMEAGEDIPYLIDSGSLAHFSRAYPSHDLPVGFLPQNSSSSSLTMPHGRLNVLTCPLNSNELPPSQTTS